MYGKRQVEYNDILAMPYSGLTYSSFTQRYTLDLAWGCTERLGMYLTDEQLQLAWPCGTKMRCNLGSAESPHHPVRSGLRYIHSVSRD